MNSEIPGVVVAVFSGVSEPTPRIETRFSDPFAWVICRLGTMLFRPEISLMNEASSAAEETVLTAVGVFWMSLARRPAVTTTSFSVVPVAGTPPGRATGSAWATCSGAAAAVAIAAEGAPGTAWA